MHCITSIFIFSSAPIFIYLHQCRALLCSRSHSLQVFASYCHPPPTNKYRVVSIASPKSKGRMRIRKRSAASDYLVANARISYQQSPLKRSPMVMPSTIHSPPPLLITQTETQEAETPIVPRYKRGRRWRDLLTSLNSHRDLSQSDDPKGKDNNTKPTTTMRNPSDARRCFGVEEDAVESGETQEAPVKLKKRSNEREGSAKVRRDRKAKAKIVEEERENLRGDISMSSSAGIHEEAEDDEEEVSERKMKRKKSKSLKSLHGVLDEYHHQYVESPQCSLPSTSTSCANGVAQY